MAEWEEQICINSNQGQQRKDTSCSYTEKGEYSLARQIGSVGITLEIKPQHLTQLI